MAFAFPTIDDIPEDRWDGLVRASPDGWVYGLYGWQRLVTAVEPWNFAEHGFGVELNGKLVAVVPLHGQPSSRVAGSSGWGGSGPVIAAGLGAGERRHVFRAAVARMIEIARDQGAVRLEVSCSPVTKSSIANRWAVNPFALEGFADRSLISQVIALDPPEERLWRGLSEIARRRVRQAEKAGYRVETVDWPASLDAYYDIHVETYRRTGVTPHPKSYFAGIAADMAQSGASRLHALMSPGNEPVGFNNTARFGQGAYYHTGCSRNAVQAVSPGYPLMWEAIKAAKAAGAAWYDVGWIFPDTEDAKQKGLTLFKTRFGGEPHRAFRAELAIAQPACRAGEAVGLDGGRTGDPGRIARVRRAANRIAARTRRLVAARAGR